MKKKVILTLLIVILPIGAFIAGCYATASFISLFIDPYTSSMASAFSKYYALVPLRENDVERAILRLESSLNGDLIGLSSLDEMKESEEKEKIVRLLGTIRTYREKYPFESDNESINNTVSNALNYGTETKKPQQIK